MLGKKNENSIDPDEIFLDSSNLPEFDVHQFEGRIEKSIGQRVIVYLGLFFVLVSFVFTGKLWSLQIAEGESYARRSENNRLDHFLIFSERGIITDRNGVELAWNIPSGNDSFPIRQYIDTPGLAHILGYVGYPKKDESGFYYQTDIVGKDGVEKFYDFIVQGKNGVKIVEADALKNIVSESTIYTPKDGENITLTIDSRVQTKLHELMENLAHERGFSGGAGIIMDVKNGDILAITNYPEYNSNILTEGSNTDVIADYTTNTGKPFLNRAISGLYTPGSVVKPYVAIGALNENIISPEKEIISTGSISVPNPYFPDQENIFTDWKAHGAVDMRRALAVSSNVYFYEIGGGYKDQKGLGIEKIGQYMKLFGLGENTDVDISGEAEGVIPNPKWKKETFDGEDWRLGDTYNTSIGQYGFQITPIQMVRAVAIIANGGIMTTPHVLKHEALESKTVSTNIDPKIIGVVQEGMRDAVLLGTAKGLNMPQVEVAAKTGTAELGVSKKRVNSWITGYFPYNNPRYAFAMVMEEGKSDNLIGSLYVMRQLLEWMAVETPEYIQ